jgi:S1-C subfamily serine protease
MSTPQVIAAGLRAAPALLLSSLFGIALVPPAALAALRLPGPQQVQLPQPQPQPRKPRLGAYLESDASGVWVRQVSPGSAAEAAGLRPGDRIVDLNGMAVQRAGQVIRGVRLHPDGKPLELTIERAGRRLRLQISLPPSCDPCLV